MKITLNTLLSSLTLTVTLVSPSFGQTGNVAINSVVLSGTSASSESRATYEDDKNVIVEPESIPDTIFELDLDEELSVPGDDILNIENTSSDARLDLTDFDLVEDEPIFLGAYERTEFDTLEAQRESAGTPRNLDADPMIPIGAVGVEAKF